jgi:hypothetical protein
MMLPTRLTPALGMAAGLLPAAGLWLGLSSPADADPPKKRAQLYQAPAVSPMARCLATWDRSSQMSKREWKESCKRVVKSNPGLYNKPF